MIEALLSIFIFVCLIAAGVIILFILQMVEQQKQKRSRFNRPQPQVHRETTFERDTSQNLYQELIRLVGGNRSTADRLVSSVQQRNPGRSASWCVEKALEDLERDRR